MVSQLSLLTWLKSLSRSKSLDTSTLLVTSDGSHPDRAHKHGRMAICHALDHRAASLAVDAGVDGLIHVFYDVPKADDVVEKIKKSGIWVTTTICTLGALAGELTGDNVTKDPRAMEHLPQALHNNLMCCWGAKREPASTANAVAITKALHAAGVPILCGTGMYHLQGCPSRLIPG